MSYRSGNFFAVAGGDFNGYSLETVEIAIMPGMKLS